MKIKAVVFDWDGVLCDSLDQYMMHFNTVLARYGLPPIRNDEFRDWLSAPTSKETFWRAGVTGDNLSEASRQFLELARGEPHSKIFPDVYDMFRWLRDRAILIFIVSAHPVPDLCEFLTRHSLTPFVASVTGDARAKGKIAALQEILQEYRLAPDELVFVEDAAVILMMARTVGCHIVGSLRGYCSEARVKAARPDKTIRTMKNLQGYINYIHHFALQAAPGATSVKKASGK